MKQQAELTPEVQKVRADILKAMQQANTSLDAGDFVSQGIQCGFVIGCMCSLENFGHDTDYEVLDNGFYGKLIIDGNIDDFSKDWKYKEKKR